MEKHSWTQNQPADHDYDAGFQSGLNYDAGLPFVTKEGLSDTVGTVPTIFAYDSWSVSTIRVSGAPRAPPVGRTGFLAAEGTTSLVPESYMNSRL